MAEESYQGEEGYNGDYGYDQGYDQGGSYDWHSDISPELQDYAKEFDSPETLLKSYLGAKNLIGKKVQDFSQEDVARYAEMMNLVNGAPTDVNGYNIQLSNEQNLVTEEEIGSLKNVAFKMGLNNDQAQQLCDVYEGMQEQYFQNVVDQGVKAAQDLAKMWGKNAEYKTRCVASCMNNVLPQMLGISAEKIAKAFEGAWMIPEAMEVFARIGEMAMDSGSREFANATPTDAAIRVQQMRSDPHTMQILMNPQHPQYQQVHAEYESLLKLKFGEQ